MKNYNNVEKEQDDVKVDPDLITEVRAIKRMNFRREPGVYDNNIIRELRGGEKLTVLENKGEWLHVQDFRNVTGYVMTMYVEEV